MNEVQVSVTVPAELKLLGDLAQSIQTAVQAKKPALEILSAALPVLFAQGIKLDQIKEELKSPKIYTFIGLLIGGGVTLYLANKAAAQVSVAAAAADAVAAPQA